jgi:hypothetical protein
MIMQGLMQEGRGTLTGQGSDSEKKKKSDTRTMQNSADLNEQGGSHKMK